jgi:hypothetical protein
VGEGGREKEEERRRKREEGREKIFFLFSLFLFSVAFHRVSAKVGALLDQ